MRALVVAQEFPWPTVGGSLLRLDAVISALGGVAEVDLFACVLDQRDLPCEVASGAPVARCAVGHHPTPDYSALRRARWLAGQLPLELATQRLEGPAAALRDFARPPYDVVWFSKLATFVGLGRPRLGPTLVDYDDLEDRKITAKLESGSLAASYPDTVNGAAHRAVASAQARLNRRRWSRLQRRVSQEVDGVAVCSELDRRRANLPNALVVPNGYDPPDHPAGRPEVTAPATLLFQGVLHYPPNADAARWLTTQILPLVRQQAPDVRVRLVGAPDTPIRRLHRPPAVTVVGRVDRMADELAGAAAVVVPVRFGSGTRVKILEAFAHRVPVVATSLAAEGLGAVDGAHLLVADTAEAFAAACIRVITDVELRRRLTDVAHQLLLECHRWDRARSVITDKACSLSAASGRAAWGPAAQATPGPAQR